MWKWFSGQTKIQIDVLNLRAIIRKCLSCKLFWSKAESIYFLCFNRVHLLTRYLIYFIFYKALTPHFENHHSEASFSWDFVIHPLHLHLLSYVSREKPTFPLSLLFSLYLASALPIQSAKLRHFPRSLIRHFWADRVHHAMKICMISSVISMIPTC